MATFTMPRHHSRGLTAPARVGSPGWSRPGTCCRSSRSRDGEPGSALPIPARSPPARRAHSRSLQGWAARAGRARCRRAPARPSGSRPTRTQGTRPRDRRRSKRTRKNMRHPPSSAPSPEAAGRPCAPGQGAQTSALHRYRVGPAIPDTVCRPPSECLRALRPGRCQPRRPAHSRLSRVSRPPWRPPSYRAGIRPALRSMRRRRCARTVPARDRARRPARRWDLGHSGG